MDEQDTVSFDAELKKHQERENLSKLFEPVLNAKAELDAHKQAVAEKLKELKQLTEHVDDFREEMKRFENLNERVWNDYNNRWVAWVRATRQNASKLDGSRICQKPFLITETVQELRSNHSWQLQIHNELEECFTNEAKPKADCDQTQLILDFLAVSGDGRNFLEEKLKIIQDEKNFKKRWQLDLSFKEKNVSTLQASSQKLNEKTPKLQLGFDNAQREWKTALSALSKASTTSLESLATPKRKSMTEEGTSQSKSKKNK